MLPTEDISYKTTIGSDLDRDGFFSELWLYSGADRTLVAEAFWSDASSEFTVSFGERPVPFSVLESFVAEARQRLPPTSQPQESNQFVNGSRRVGA